MTKNISIRFFLWAVSDFGGLERRYLRILNQLASIDGLRLSLVVQERCLKSALAFAQNKSIEIIVIKSFLSNGKISKFIISLIDFLKFLSFARCSKIDSFVLCANPGIVAALISLVMPKGKKLIVPNAMLFGDPAMKFLDRLGIKFLRYRETKIDHLSDEPLQYFRSLTSTTFSQYNHSVAPCSFTDYSKVELVESRDIDIAMIARFVEEKGYDLLESIDEDLRLYNFHCCGFGPRKISLQSANIYKTSNSFEILARTKIFLSIQRGNNFPSQSLLEAMASGCAIIATDVGETRKILDESCAILIPYSESALLFAIRRLVNDENLRKELSLAARRRVVSDYTVERYCRYFMNELI